MEQRPLPPSGRPPPPPGGVHARGMSPRNSSAMMAASMAMGGTPRGRGGAGIGVFAQGSTDSLLDPAAEDEAERLRKKRQAIFRSKYEVDEKIVSRNKALVNLVKVVHPAHPTQTRVASSRAARVPHAARCPLRAALTCPGATFPGPVRSVCGLSGHVAGVRPCRDPSAVCPRHGLERSPSARRSA